MWGGTIGSNTGARNANRCRHVAVRMSGTAGTLAGRIANCTDAADRAYPWYDLIYIGNGMGWGLDYTHVQQHYCLFKNWNISTTERQMGTIRWNNASGLNSDNAYRIVSSSTVGRNTSDPGNDMRLQIVDNPFKPGSPCLLHRVRSSDARGSAWRSALRQYGNSVSPYNSSNNPDQWLTDRMQRHKEWWWATAILYGDSASFDQGEAESWANGTTAGIGSDHVVGWQLHADDGGGSIISGANAADSGQPTPNYTMWVGFTTTADEANIKLRLKRFRAAGPTKLDISQDYIAFTGSGVDGAMETAANSVLWELSPVPLRTKWLGFVSRLVLSPGSDGVLQTWHEPLDTYTAGAAPTQIVNVSGYNDLGCGAWGDGYYANSTTKRNPEHRRGDPYLCPAEIYMAQASMPIPSVTMRTIPVRFHERNPARTVNEYANDLMTLLKSAAY